LRGCPVARVRCLCFLLAGAAFLSSGTALALESSAIPGSAEYMRPKGRIENLPTSNSSVLQCYIFPTRPGVIYQMESSHDLANWSAEGAGIYGLGHEQVVTMREFTPPPPPEPGSETPPSRARTGAFASCTAETNSVAAVSEPSSSRVNGMRRRLG
jgi:hypothetical protein